MEKYRAIIIILDSVGVGELPDAADYGDRGSNTLGNLASTLGGLQLPHLGRLGLGNIIALSGVPAAVYPTAAYGKMAERSAGKDTTTGHWELMGLVTTTPFPTYPRGFPPEIIDPFQQAIGTKIIGNKPASGTEIIKELGAEHLATVYPIIYTSADSVFQIAAHEEAIPLARLYEICKIARGLLQKPHNVSRVIARPFTGRPGSFTRTKNRQDFSLSPPSATLLDRLRAGGQKTLAIGKINDIFAGQGISKSIPIKNNREGIQTTITAIRQQTDYRLLFTNLIDFDMLYGHRNDPGGYYRALKEFDNYLPSILKNMRKHDILIITADHGCDPTAGNTDHSREYVPLLVYGSLLKPGVNLKTRNTFADLGQTLAGLWQLPPLADGTSFLNLIL